MPDYPNIPYYHIDHLIAEGGTARVYWGIDLRSGFPVAIKELKIRHLSNPIIRQKFRDMEAQLYLYAQHPRIPKLVDFIDNAQKNQMFIIMEFVEGRSLEQYIYRQCGPIPEERALPLFLQVLDTVGFLHRIKIPHMQVDNGILHLDIKSNNIMLLPGDREIKLIDLGIASRLSDMSNSTGFGTPAYMPPEQFEKGRCGKFTDIFALGIMLFEMLSGHLPFVSNESSGRRQVEDIRDKIKNHPTPQMRQYYPFVNDELQTIVERALHKQPFERYQSCEEFARDIENYMNRHRKHFKR